MQILRVFSDKPMVSEEVHTAPASLAAQPSAYPAYGYQTPARAYGPAVAYGPAATYTPTAAAWPHYYGRPVQQHAPPQPSMADFMRLMNSQQESAERREAQLTKALSAMGKKRGRSQSSDSDSDASGYDHGRRRSPGPRSAGTNTHTRDAAPAHAAAATRLEPVNVRSPHPT